LQQTEYLQLWLFTPDLCFSSSYQPSSSSQQRKDPTRAIKAYHKPLSDPSGFLNKNSTSYEHLLFPSSLYIALLEALETSKQLLPAVARKFQDWDVGILERFDASDMGFVDIFEPGDDEENKVVSQEDFEKMVQSIPGSEGLV
jgi:hypothetical protein